MGQWGVKSYENDDADDALDAGFEQVHGQDYEDLMDDANPLSFEQVQQRLADARTLSAAMTALEQSVGSPADAGSPDWDEAARLAFAGIVVRHAELGVTLPPVLRDRAVAWLESEEIDWEDATTRRLRRDKELALLRKARLSETRPDA